MRFITAIRERIKAVIGTTIGAIGLLAVGALFAFYLSPKQAIKAGKLDRLPELEPAAIANLPAGEELLLSGYLEGNPLLESNFVAYRLDEWMVKLPDYEDEDDEPKGSWERVEQIIPSLSVNAGGHVVWLVEGDSTILSGNLHEEFWYSDAYDEAKYQGDWVPDGSWRFRGLLNRDLVTAHGSMSASGDMVLEELYAGERAAFLESEHGEAKGLLTAGFCMLGLSPVVFASGLVYALLGRRRRRRHW